MCDQGGSRGSVKIGFDGVIFHNLVILIKLFKIRYLNLDKALLFPRNQHCAKSVRIWSYSGPHFPAFGLNTKYLSVFSANARKCGENAEYGRVLRSADHFSELQLPQSLIFFAEFFALVSYLKMPTKGCSGFFLFCVGLELLIKM